MSILSIQSHVVYGYVGNKAAVYPLQSMGYDVWPVNTVQFSNHTGYGKWQGDIFSREHIHNVIKGIEDLGIAGQCQAILSGYMGSSEICEEVQDTVQRFKLHNKDLLYLCDPVIGSTSCYVKPEVLDFFRNKLFADIITPNKFEAETLSGLTIQDIGDLKKVAQYFHNRNIKIVVITGIKLDNSNDQSIFVSDSNNCYLTQNKEYDFPIAVNGTGDLFSAIYLGSYLANKDIALALQHTVYYMQQVLHNTWQKGTRELQVVTAQYSLEINDNLPNITKI